MRILLIVLIVFVSATLARAVDSVARPENTAKISSTNALAFAIRTATQIEIFALDPVTPVRGTENKLFTLPSFSGHAILESATITDPKEIQLLADSLANAIDAGKSPAWCFSPRHGLRVKTVTGELRLLVCFACSGVKIEGVPSLSFAPIDPSLARQQWETVFAAHFPARKN